MSRPPHLGSGRAAFRSWLLVCLLVLTNCHLLDPTNPIYYEAPETHFPAGPALQAAQVTRAEDVQC